MRTLKNLLFLFVVLALTSVNIFAQTNGKQITLKSANSLKGDKRKGYQRLIGNVEFEHQGAIMTCDSAHFYPDKNSLEAFSHVHIRQGDSINVFGDHLKYDGNTRQADLTKNVMMTDGDMTLTTDAITYDMKGKVASYSNGGKIISDDNVLTSQIGAYSTEGKMLTFKKNVILTNPEYIMKCDTLKYLPGSRISYFLGPTTITSTNGTSTIYCENGFYDSNADICQFQKNATIVTKDQTLQGDSIWYNRKTGIGKAMKNVEIRDTAQDVTIRGDLAIHNDNTNTSMITGHALFIQAFDNDSLFLHADTLKSITLLKQKAYNKIRDKNDTTSNDSGKVVLAYYHVRFYKTDLQGKCDSLNWTTLDSMMHLFGDPVLWSDGSQLTSERISIQTSNGKILQMEMDNEAFIISKEDSTRYNQIKGKKMTGLFRENELYRIYVEGNGQTLYYAKDSATVIGVNRADCRRLTIDLKDQAVSSIRFYEKPEATLYPPMDLPPKEALLKGFRWRETEQPKAVSDLLK